MRKNTKDRILEIFDTLYEAHDIIKNCIDNEEHEQAQNLLCDCQETAIEIGNTISENEDFDGLHYYEEYCEALYQVSVAHDITGSNAKCALDKSLQAAENATKSIETKLEIVFMPYKATMWDSLESIWRAAVDDPQCNAHVVPIPYYDRNPNGSFGTLHYEGAEFPANVPVKSYLSFDIEALQPDAIFIHNPYDNYNRVTSVAPQYYSFELKKHTDMLVYVPYYVVETKVNPALLHLACANHVDKIMVQSKAVRDDFKKAYQNSANQNKFIAIGSPKFDAIVNSSKDDYVIPKEWSDIINGRKTVLYNTSIVSALSDPVLYLEKMVATFNYFSNNKEYVLWWRPHPLLENTFKSMITPLYNEFIRLRNLYIDSSIGVYDCTSDLNRALICTDMYYGDLQSSISVLYSATGKPMTFAHIENDAHASTFDEDCIKYSRDNSNLEILKRNENYDGTAGHNIYQYIKGELM